MVFHFQEKLGTWNISIDYVKLIVALRYWSLTFLQYWQNQKLKGFPNAGIGIQGCTFASKIGYAASCKLIFFIHNFHIFDCECQNFNLDVVSKGVFSDLFVSSTFLHIITRSFLFRFQWFSFSPFWKVRSWPKSVVGMTLIAFFIVEWWGLDFLQICGCLISSWTWSCVAQTRVCFFDFPFLCVDVGRKIFQPHSYLKKSQFIFLSCTLK